MYDVSDTSSSPAHLIDLSFFDKNKSETSELKYEKDVTMSTKKDIYSDVQCVYK